MRAIEFFSRQYAVARAATGVRRSLLGLGLGLGLMAAGAAVSADPQPTAAMMAPVQGLVAFMTTLRSGEHPSVFVHHGLCIIENFKPYLFCGPDAAAQWERGFRAHEAGETSLAVKFGAAIDFSQSGDRAYFSLPTTWTGMTHGHPFEEHGAWAFVLERHADVWQVRGYGWAVSSSTESTP